MFFKTFDTQTIHGARWGIVQWHGIQVCAVHIGVLSLEGYVFFSRKVFYSRVENDYIRHMTHTDFLNNDKAPELECFLGGGGVFAV